MSSVPHNPQVCVTVGIPVRNAERWIRGAVESALRLEGIAVQVVVVDDGSTDSTPEILKGFSDRVLNLRTEHQGANAARNLVLRHATGEWVQYLDADDELLPRKIADQLKGVYPDTDAIYSPVLVEEWNGTALEARYPSEVNPGLDLFALWLSWQLPQTGGVLWRRSVLLQLGGWNESIPCCQEHELYLRALQAGVRFRFAPDAGSIYRIWSEETLCRRDPRQTIAIKTELMKKMRQWLEDSGKWNAQYARIAGRACFEMARTLAKHDLGEATEYYAQRQHEGLIYPSGPAAPALYRFCWRLFGFSAAERLARRLRGIHSFSDGRLSP